MLRMKNCMLRDLLCVCVNVFPKYRNKIYPEAAQQWSHGEFRSLHVQFYMLSFAPEVWWWVSGCWVQAAAGVFWPLGVWKAILHASLLLTRGDVNFSDGFQLGSFCGTSDHVFNLYFCCWGCEMETLIFMIHYYHMLISEEGDLLCEGVCRELDVTFLKKGSVYVVQLLLVLHKGSPDAWRT